MPVLSAACATGTANGGVINGSLTPATSCAANTIGYTAGGISNGVFTPITNAYYVQGGLGTLPNGSRDTIFTGRTDNLDLTAVKRFTFHDRFGLEVQIQAFNVLNHSQYLPGSINQVNSISSTGTGSSNFANVTKGSLFGNSQVDFGNNARAMQLAGKITF